MKYSISHVMIMLLYNIYIGCNLLAAPNVDVVYNVSVHGEMTALVRDPTNIIGKESTTVCTSHKWEQNLERHLRATTNSKMSNEYCTGCIFKHHE